MRFSSSSFLAVVATLAFASPAFAATLQVGPGKAHAAPCSAFAAASDGDTIEIDAAGTYVGDVCAISKNQLTIRGVNGRPKIDAGGTSAQGKAIWVITGNDTTIENVELTGCSVVDQNGAGIRQEGANLTLRGCYLHDNDDGVLAGDNANSEILFERCEFDQNGFGDGQSHNFYINHVKRFTIRESWTHRAKIGHLLKSRALENYVLYNRITGEEGTDSYELDFPNAGLTYVIGNLVQQGPGTDNPSFIAYGEEGVSNPSDALFVVNNTFVNDKGSGTFVNVAGGVTTPAVLRNNIFFGGGTITNQGSAVVEASCTDDPLFVGAASFDYHLGATSPCKDKGVDPGMGSGLSLLPDRQYVHPTSTEGRVSVGAIDAGAYELGGGVATGGAGGAGATSTGAGMTTGSTSANGSTGSSATTSGAGGGGSDGSSGGCDCSTDADGPDGATVCLVVAAGIVAMRRRRRGRGDM